MEKQTRPAFSPRTLPEPSTRRAVTVTGAILSVLSLTYFQFRHSFRDSQSELHSVFDQVQTCAIHNLQKDLSFLDPAEPIKPEEFIDRQDRLAQALAASNIDAFVLEPGYTFQYYGNISQQQYEPWEPEERPFLMIVLPEKSDATGKIQAKTAFLSPHFEEGRVRMLGIPSRDAQLDIVVWEEHWNPYTTLLESRVFEHFEYQPKLMVDEEIRDYIVRGLDAAGFQTVGLNAAVELVRQQKTSAEVELIRTVNTGTVEAVRAMRPCLVPDLTENEVTDILNNALLSIGFSLFFNIVLFEENGALPHGGFITGWKKLTHETMVVIDVGAHYLGYSSDICRSFFIDPPKPQHACRSFLATLKIMLGFRTGEIDAEWAPTDPKLHAEKLQVWDIVFDAQTAAAGAFKPNATAASIDIAARSVIESAGYGYGFTHRLGHGIGIKAHESPYLNKWNNETLLQPGMTFTNEPGIYLENRFGVRHEDIYLVKANEEAELLSGRRAQGPYDP